jgi:pimeloyl-ACP methyl ester carboxylesterase
MSTFVLVPGMWLGAWAWYRVTGRLRAAGHTVFPLSLTGLAERHHLASRDTTIHTHIADIVALLEAEELEDVVLVGHSYGGQPVGGAADRVPERIRHVVYVDSGPLPDGMSHLAANGPEAEAATRAQVGDGFLVPPREWDAQADPMLLAGLSPDDLAELARRADPHPFGTLVAGAHRSGRGAGIPRTLIACCIPPDQMRAMIEQGHPFGAGLADADIVPLPTGHWPMFSEPDRLTALLGAV